MGHIDLGIFLVNFAIFRSFQFYITMLDFSPKHFYTSPFVPKTEDGRKKKEVTNEIPVVAGMFHFYWGPTSKRKLSK